MTALLIYAYVIIFGTVTAFGCYLGSLKYIQPAEASILLSIIFLGAAFGPWDILGTGMILGTVFLLAQK